MISVRLATWSLVVVGALLTTCGCESRRIGAASWESLELEIVGRGQGAPVSGAVCSIYTGTRLIARGTSAETGCVTLAQSFPEAVTLEIEDPAGTYAPRRLELREAGHHRIELDRGIQASLRVVDERGKPVGDAEVIVWGLGGSVHGFAVREGAWSFGPLAPGSSKLVVSAPGYAAVVLDVRLDASKDGETVDLRSVRLTPGGATLLGRVETSPARRPQSAVLRFSGAGVRATIQPDGGFRFTGLPSLQDDGLSGGVMLVILRDGEEVYARDLELSGEFLDVGTIELD